MQKEPTYEVGYTRISFRFISGKIPILRSICWVKENGKRWSGDEGRFNEHHLFWNLWWLDWKLWQEHLVSATGTFDMLEPL